MKKKLPDQLKKRPPQYNYTKFKITVKRIFMLCSYHFAVTAVALLQTGLGLAMVAL